MARCRTWICGTKARVHLDGCPLWEGKLPVAGERIVFGEHRLAIPDAETAEAWAPRTEADRIARFRRWLKGAE